MKRALAVLILVAAPAVAHAEVTRAQELMGTVCEISVPDSDARWIDAAFAEGKRIENVISTWRDDTELARLNHDGHIAPSMELRTLVNFTMLWSRKTDAAFDPLVRPLIDAWDIRGKGRIPTKEALAAATQKAALDNVEVTNQGIALRNGAMIDEGAWGKGYALDRMMAVLRSHEVTRARINFGGQVAAYGQQPFVYIADPEHRDKPLVGVLLGRNSISTSSGSVQSFTVDGRTFTHLVDPHTGEALPPRGSVSVLHNSAMIADMLSTALYVMGPEKGLEWAKKNSIIAVFITGDGKVVTSQEIPHLQVLTGEK